MKISFEDLEFHKRQTSEDIEFHDSEMKRLNNPEDVIAGYNGLFRDSDNGVMAENYLFIAVATMLPSLFFQMPKPMIRAKNPKYNFEAAILNALVSASMGEEEKEENQLAIIDAFLPYGYGVVKTGYNSRRKKVPKKERRST